MIALTYRSPSSTPKNNYNLNNFLRSIRSNRSRYIVLGDIKHRDVDWQYISTNHDENSKEHQIIDAVKDSYLDQHFDRPTRVTKNNEPSLLDLMLADKIPEPTSIEYISPLGKGDHTLIQAKFDLGTTKRCKERLNFNKGSYVELRSGLNTNIVYEELQRLEQNWGKIKSTLDCAVKKFIPKIKICINHNKKPMRPKVRDAVREKEKIWRDVRRDKTQENYGKHSKARNKVRKLTRNCVQIHEEDISKSIKHQPKKFWNYVNKNIKSTGTIPALKISDDNLAKTNKEKATALFDFFK